MHKTPLMFLALKCPTTQRILHYVTKCPTKSPTIQECLAEGWTIVSQELLPRLGDEFVKCKVPNGHRKTLTQDEETYLQLVTSHKSIECTHQVLACIYTLQYIIEDPNIDCETLDYYQDQLAQTITAHLLCNYVEKDLLNRIKEGVESCGAMDHFYNYVNHKKINELFN